MKHFFINTLLFVLIVLVFADQNHDIELARRFLVLEKYEKAEAILEKLFAQDPDDPEIQNMLLQVYKNLKEYNKMEGVLQSVLLRKPNDSSLWAELGAMYLAQNKPEEAKKSFDKAIKLSPKNKQLAKEIHEAYFLYGFIDEDIKFIHKARSRTNDKYLLALELARLYEIKGRFDDAVEEYANYLKKYPDRFGDVERKIDISGRSQEELLQLRKSLDALLSTDIPRWQPWRLISIVEQKLGNIDRAFDAIIKADESQSEKYRGRLVANFVEDMLRLKNFEYAEKGARYLVSKSSGNYSRTGRLYLAKALRGLGKYEDAIAQLDSIGTSENENKNVNINWNNTPSQFQPPRRRYQSLVSEDATVLKAEIYLENLKNPDMAEKTIAPQFEGSRWMKNEDAVKIKGEIFIYRRQFRDGIVFLTSAFQMNPRSEPVAYLLAMSYFFAGVDDTALNALHNVVSRFPKNEMGNEAVELILIMQTAGENTDKIREPIYSMFVRDTITALEQWQKLLSDEGLKDLGDYVMWKIGNCQMTLDDSTAYSTFKSLVEKYPKSFYAPLSLEFLADKLLAEGNKPDAAEMYVKIINDYPDAVNIEVVRDKLKEIGENL
ncbi:tetratricopeptide repeat protein [bacterium]|nr:tetratricopeptide repeat protein [bacterium]